DGIDPDPIPITVTITVAGDRMVADFTGSAPQVKGAINSPLPFTKSAVYACVRHLIGGEPPNNEGYFRPIEVIAPAGTVVNPDPHRALRLRARLGGAGHVPGWPRARAAISVPRAGGDVTAPHRPPLAPAVRARGRAPGNAVGEPAEPGHPRRARAAGEVHDQR